MMRRISFFSVSLIAEERIVIIADAVAPMGDAAFSHGFAIGEIYSPLK